MGEFFIQWAIFSVIGTVAFLAYVRLDGHFHFHPPLAFAVALMPAYFLLGMVFIDIGPGPGTTVVGAVAFFGDAMYYGLVLLSRGALSCARSKRNPELRRLTRSPI
jgi:hypothetical protein